MKASDDQKDEPDDGTDIEKNTIAHDVKIFDENENDVEDMIKVIQKRKHRNMRK